MKSKNETKVEFVKNVLEKEGIYYTEFANGQFQVDKINFWATTEKWYDTINKESGVGLNSFITRVKHKQ